MVGEFAFAAHSENAPTVALLANIYVYYTPCSSSLCNPSTVVIPGRQQPPVAPYRDNIGTRPVG